MDVKSIFLNRYLKKIYLCVNLQALRAMSFQTCVQIGKNIVWVKASHKNMVWKIVKISPGEQILTWKKIDNTLFLLKNGKNLLIVQIYINDIIFGATNKSSGNEFAKIIGSKFDMSMMGELDFFPRLQLK